MSIRVVAGEKNNAIARKIAQQLQASLVHPHIYQFADGELHVLLPHPPQFNNKIVVLVQSTSIPVNEHLLAVLFLTHALKNAGAKKIIGVIPYFGYSRQEKSEIPGKPGQAAVVAKMLQVAGMSGLISVALHTRAIESFFSIPTIDVGLIDIIDQHIKQQFNILDDVCLVAPDKGAEKRVQNIAEKLGVGFLTIIKKRFAPDKIRVIETIGKCRGRTAIIIDDIITTGSTVLQACDQLEAMGFENLFGYFIHPIFAHGAFEKMVDSRLQKIFVSNTIPLQKENKKIKIFDVSDVVTSVVKTIVENSTRNFYL